MMPTAPRVFYLLGALLASLVLAGCGSDSHAAGQNGRGVLVRIGPGIPAGVANRITTIVSPIAEADAAQVVAIPEAADASDALVLASDGEKTFLMAFADGDVTLDSGTTAVALVRLAMGAAQLSATTPAAIEGRIRRAGSFPALRGMVDANLAAGRALHENHALFVTAKHIVAEVAGQEIESTQLLASATSMPHDFFNGGERDRLWLTNATQQDLVVNNLTALSWRVSVTPGDSPPQYVSKREGSVFEALAAYGRSASTLRITGSGPVFTVTADQGGDAPILNLQLWLNSVITSVLELVPARELGVSECLLHVAGRFVNDKLPELVAQPSASAAFGHWWSVTRLDSPAEFILGVVDAAQSCPNVPVLKTVLARLPVAFVKNILPVIKALNTARTVVSIWDVSSQMDKYWKTASFSVQVCKRDGEVVPCVFGVRINPSAASLDVGQAVKLSATAIDEGGREIELGSGMSWASADPAVASVDAHGTVTGVSVGETEITATDPASLKSATATITVTADPISARFEVTSMNCVTSTAGTGADFVSLSSCAPVIFVEISCPEKCPPSFATAADYQVRHIWDGECLLGTVEGGHPINARIVQTGPPEVHRGEAIRFSYGNIFKRRGAHLTPCNGMSAELSLNVTITHADGVQRVSQTFMFSAP